jgi:Fe-S cluster assembly scaffold protein SufB
MKKIIIDQLGLQKILIDEPGEYEIELVVPGAEAEIFGAFSSKETEVTEVKVIIHHLAANTQAKTTLRGVARDSSKISFTGRIIIDPNCGNSNSF